MLTLLRRSYVPVLHLSKVTSYSAVQYSSEKLPDHIEHATGLERRELLAHRAGNLDPFHSKVQKRGPGTKDQPNLVPSFMDKRIVGCICEEDSTVISWMWVHKDEPKRCGCGYWFKLTEAKPI